MAHSEVQQAFNLAVQHHQAGRFYEAEQLYRQVLAQEPGHAEAMQHLGVIAHQVGRIDIAVDLIRRAIALNPNYAEAYNNLGNVLRDKGEIDEAIAACHRAIALRANYAQAHNNLGNALKDIGRLDEALAAYRQAIAIRPDLPEALNNLGNALKDKGQLDEALAAYRQAIAVKPNYAEAHNNLGNALRDIGQLDEAIAACRQALALNPELAEAHNNLGNALRGSGRLNEAIAAHRRAIAIKPDYAQAHSNVVFTLHFHGAHDARAIAEEHRCWNRQHAAGLTSPNPEPLREFAAPAATPSTISGLRHCNDRSPDRRLRIGYLSPDFREHVVGQNLLPLFCRHDRRQFEVTCYSQVRCPDAMTSQFQETADCWRNIVGISDEQVANQIREDRIDLLADLALHTADNRLLVFARKPAPVQVSYLGYCGSTGMSAMDYRLSDPYLDPPGTDLSCYSEKTLHLPRSYWCYQPRPAPAVSPAPVLKNGVITFGCLNNFAKISPAALDLWARILVAVPNSRTIIHAPPGEPVDRITRQMTGAGVAKDRLLFLGLQLWPKYVQTYSQIDIAFDPFPYGGGITTCDALWMGVPVISLSGQTAVGRGGRSILSNVGLADFIAFTPDQYAHIAIDLAQDVNRMSDLRRNMRARMLASPLMDADGFARDVEAAYRRMWREWCETGSAKSQTTV